MTVVYARRILLKNMKLLIKSGYFMMIKVHPDDFSRPWVYALLVKM